MPGQLLLRKEGARAPAVEIEAATVRRASCIGRVIRRAHGYQLGGRPAHHVMGNETFRVGRRYGNWKIDRDGSNGSCSVSSTTAIDGSVSVAVCTWNVPVRMSS